VNWPPKRDSKADILIVGANPIHVINPVDKSKLSRYTSHRRSTTVSLETYPSIRLPSEPTGTVFDRKFEPRGRIISLS